MHGRWIEKVWAFILSVAWGPFSHHLPVVQTVTEHLCGRETAAALERLSPALCLHLPPRFRGNPKLVRFAVWSDNASHEAVLLRHQSQSNHTQTLTRPYSRRECSRYFPRDLSMRDATRPVADHVTPMSGRRDQLVRLSVIFMLFSWILWTISTDTL